LYQIHLKEWALCNSSNLWKTLTCKKIFFNNIDGDAAKGLIKTVMGLVDWGVAVATNKQTNKQAKKERNPTFMMLMA